MNKKARTISEEGDAQPVGAREEVDGVDQVSDQDEESYGDSEEDSSDEEEELEALQLLSQQMQVIKASNQQLKKTLVAIDTQKKQDRSNNDLVASLFAGRKAASESKQDDEIK